MAQAAALVDRPGAEVGVLLRNRPASVGLLLGVLRAGGCVVTINPGRGQDRTRDDIAALDLAVLAGDPDDLARLVPDAARPTTAAVAGARRLPSSSAPAERTVDADGDARPGVAVRMLTSGTTGPPKRVDLSYETLERVLVGAKHYESNRDETVRLRRGVAIVNSPLVHLGGLFRVLQCVSDGRSFCLLERFSVDGWVDAVRRHRPATASLVPAALRMVLEADLDPADLRQPPLRRLGHRTARSRRRRRLHGPVRHPGARAPTPPPSSVGAWRDGTSRTTGPSGRPSGAASAGRTPGASCAWSTRTPA